MIISAHSKFSLTVFATYQNITGGIAFPSARYCAASLPTSSKFSGNDCILATSLGVNLLYLSFTNKTGSVLFKDTFARCAPTVLHGFVIS